LKKILLIGLLIAICVVSYLIYILKYEKDYSPTAIEAINKVRGDSAVNYLIHEHPVEDGKVIFYLRNINDNQIVVSHEYIRKSYRGWKWIFGGGHSGSGVSLINPSEVLGDPITYFYSNDLIEKEVGETPFPLIHGIILNPEISRVVVKDSHSGLERQATIINVRDKFNLYYVFLDSNQGEKFDIKLFDREGHELAVKTIDENPQISSSFGNVKDE
jgi:hypothetical protein